MYDTAVSYNCIIQLYHTIAPMFPESRSGTGQASHKTLRRCTCTRIGDPVGYQIPWQTGSRMNSTPGRTNYPSDSHVG